MRLFVGILLIAATASAEEATPPPPAPISLTRTTAAITLDGDLSDPGWLNAAKIDRFYETSPGNNTPPKVKTTVLLTYDSRNFYIGVRAEDSDIRKLRAPYVERDGVLGTDDNIAVFLDTRNDKRSAIELRVNPRGIQGDAIYNDANQNEDFSPDFFFDTAARIDSGGWTAEYRIPFSSLRYPNRDPQTWNILVWRNYPREFRYAFHSAPIARDSNCFICHTHPITGLTQLPEAGHFVAAPYVTAQRMDNAPVPGAPLENGGLKSDAGVDVKWNPTATNTVDLTVNPDFSQVESDVAQVTVNRRFAVFYPEKRPFFLEGFDLFDTPLRIAYTRNITSPRWGLRSTGKIGDSAYTVLVTDDRGGGLTIVPGPLGNDFVPQDFRAYSTIARIRHDLGKSFVGAVLTDRELNDGGHNRVFGPDFQWRPTDSDAITAQALYSDTDDHLLGVNAKSHAFIASWNRIAARYDAQLDLRDIGDRFRADLGFVPQVGYREALLGTALRFYPESRLVSFVRPNLHFDEQYNRDGTIQRYFEPGIFLIGAKNLLIDTWLDPKQVIRVRDKQLTQSYGTLMFQVDPSRRISRITLTIRAGQNIDFENARVGRGLALSLATTVRPIDRLTFVANLNRETLDVRGGRLFTAIIERLKTTYSFSAKSLVRVIGQYVTTQFPGERQGDFSGSVLYSYRVNWQTSLFVGYGDDRELLVGQQHARLDRSLFMKLSYAFLR